MMEPEKLESNQFITILEWKSAKAPQAQGDIFGLMLGGGRSMEDRSYVGEILQVQAVDLPFIMAAVRSGESAGRQVRMDSRRCEFKELSPDYVNVALSSGKDSEILRTLKYTLITLKGSRVLLDTLRDSLKKEDLENLEAYVELAEDCINRLEESCRKKA